MKDSKPGLLFPHYDFRRFLITKLSLAGLVFLSSHVLAADPFQVAIDFASHSIDSYVPAQDVSGTFSVEDGGATLRLVGNTWKKIDFPYTVTANTVIEFDFASSQQGEVHGIGFDTDDVLSKELTFKLYGTQAWGLPDFDNYDVAPGVKHYIIPVGLIYTGTFDRLFFAMDDDANANGESVFSNVRVYEPGENAINFNSYNVDSYVPAQDVTQVYFIEDGGATLRLPGNTWKKIDFPYTVTANTVIEFDFASSQQGEVHGIGFDTDDVLSKELTFKLYGTQAWGLPDFDNYDVAPGYKHYVIPVGSFYTGAFDRLFFAMDDDANASGESVFSNVRVYEPGENAINFNSYNIDSFNSTQDVTNTFFIEDGGATLRLPGNTWKKIDFPYTVTANTVIEFDFASSQQGEVHGIGFDTDDVLSKELTFKLYGTQAWGLPDFDNYDVPPGFKHYVIPVGSFYTGAFDRLFFAMDDDANASGESIFSNVRVYDAVNTDPPPPPPENTPPECAILAPGGDVSIMLGDSVYFTGGAVDPDAGDVLSYEWDFGGGADVRPTILDPGPVLFDVTNGLFVAEFIVTDAAGARCSTQRLVEVGSPPADLPPTVTEEPAPGTAEAGDGENVVLAFNDLGMHCADLGSYPFSILPPFNTVNAQVVRKGSRGSNRPVILNDTAVSLQYSAASSVNDPVGAGSINSTSQNYPVGALADDAIVRKTDFWDDFDGTNSIAELLFPGLHPVPDEGLQTVANNEPGNAHGRYMPGITDPYYNNDPQAFSGFDVAKRWFTAQGIPMTSIDDTGRFNSYPLMRVQAVDIGSGAVLATTDAVAPVSTEVDCRDCHALGEVGADPLVRTDGPLFVVAASSDRVDVEAAAKHNILILHDFQHGTHFVIDNQPVLCASCHRSNALAEVGGPGGISGISNMSAVMHGFHGRLQVNGSGELIRDGAGEPVLIDPPGMTGNELPLIPTGDGIPMEQNCFNCHPGKITQCFRGAMYTAGQKCDDCHGDMLAMGGEFPLLTTGEAREPWADEPKCSSCHSGHGGDPIGTLAYDPADPAATPIELADSRFAENPGSLYRNSLDNHAGIACEACHGSPHAIWPNRNPNANDNVTAIQLQGHAGTIKECTVCHTPNSFPNGTLEGPHGMHPVNEPNWIKSRGDYYHEDFVWENGNDRCAACHGADHRGTRLSRVPVDRVLRDAEGVVRATLAAGDIVSCGLCHSIEKSFSD